MTTHRKLKEAVIIDHDGLDFRCRKVSVRASMESFRLPVSTLSAAVHVFPPPEAHFNYEVYRRHAYCLPLSPCIVYVHMRDTLFEAESTNRRLAELIGWLGDKLPGDEDVFPTEGPSARRHETDPWMDR